MRIGALNAEGGIGIESPHQGAALGRDGPAMARQPSAFDDTSPTVATANINASNPNSIMSELEILNLAISAIGASRPHTNRNAARVSSITTKYVLEEARRFIKQAAGVAY